MMLRHLLVPLDGSPTAERALPCAQRLATDHGATLHLVRVVDLPPEQTRVAAQLAAMKLLSGHVSAAITYLEMLRAQLTANGCAVQVRVFTGDTATALLHYEQAAAIDLVAMCSRGREAIPRATAGPVTTAMVRRGRAPVLLLPSSGTTHIFDHAIVLLEGAAQGDALDAVTALAPVVRTVTLLRTIARPAQAHEAEQYLEQAAGRLQGTVEWCAWRVEQGDPARVLRSLASRDTLVVLAAHGHDDLARLRMRTMAETIAHDAGNGVLLWRTGVRAVNTAEPIQPIPMPSRARSPNFVACRFACQPARMGRWDRT